MDLSASSCSCYLEDTGPGALSPSFCSMACRQWSQDGARVRSWQGCSSVQSLSRVQLSCQGCIIFPATTSWHETSPLTSITSVTWGNNLTIMSISLGCAEDEMLGP